VELDIRLWWEVHQHQADVENRDFDSFANSNFDVDASGSIKPKVNAVGLSGSELRRLMDIREALDPLAHFNFVRARLQINAYNNKYGLAADIDSNRRVGAMLLKDFKDEPQWARYRFGASRAEVHPPRPYPAICAVR
jgi:hypothetical protein